ncbi:MAG: hypothetical protein QOD54_1645, partial [Sphingomonadales bacterium]|nr:hypothetical protein [Sphingomonadales bacterium]
MEMNFTAFKARIADAGSERRRAGRSPIELDATMRELGASGVDATIL